MYSSSFDRFATLLLALRTSTVATSSRKVTFRVVARYMGSGIIGLQEGGIRDHGLGIRDHSLRIRDHSLRIRDHGLGIGISAVFHRITDQTDS